MADQSQEAFAIEWKGRRGGKGRVNVDGDLGEWEGLLTLPRLADVFRRDGDKLVAVPDGLVLLGKRELALQGGRGGGQEVSGEGQQELFWVHAAAGYSQNLRPLWAPGRSSRSFWR